MPGNVLTDRLSKVQQQAAGMLDRVSNLVPEAKPPRNQMPFEEYLRRAKVVAAQDAEFGKQLELALEQRAAAARGMKS